MPIILDGTNGAFLPTWTTATRPASPANGEIGYNSTTAQLDQYVGGAWSSVPTGSAAAATPTALGTVYGKTGTSQDTFVGYNAGLNTTGLYNSALGVDALKTNTTGEQITAIGWNSGKNSTGTRGTFVGTQSGQDSTGTDNTGIGNQALQQVSSGAYNTGVGAYALAGATAITGTYNVAVGYQAGYNITSGTLNVVMGDYAGYRVSTGTKNVLLGSGSATNLTTGTGNIAIGESSGNALVTGSYNTYIGYQTGSGTKTSGVDCIYIGRTITPGNATVNGELVINTNGNNQTGRGDGTGLISTGGNIFQQSNSATWAVSSDRRLKKNIVDNNEGLNKLTQIQVRNFEYRLPEEVTELPQDQAIEKQGVQLGVIAQELKEILPECVKTESTGVMTVDADNLTWYLINSVKELKAELDILKAKVA